MTGLIRRTLVLLIVSVMPAAAQSDRPSWAQSRVEAPIPEAPPVAAETPTTAPGVTQAPAVPAKPTVKPAAKPAPKAAAVSLTITDDPASNGVKEVVASPRYLTKLSTKLRFTTLIQLPDGEDVMDVVCGDKDFWVISTTRNMAHVKPAKEGAETNLNLVTASGTIYSFLLREDSKATPDLKVLVSADANGPALVRKWVPVAQFEALQADLIVAKAQIDAERTRAAEQVAAAKVTAPAALHFDYQPVKDEKPFHVKALWHDGRFTYIQHTAREGFSIYETKDGKPTLVDFQAQGSTYIVSKVIENGYLAIGKSKLPFAMKPGAGN